MPVYTYRREDGTTFDVRQKFSDAPLAVDPDSGQKVVRVVQSAGVIFKGSGFYINDSKGASKTSLNGKAKSENGSGESKTESKAESKAESSDSKPESKSDSKSEVKASA